MENLAIDYHIIKPGKPLTGCIQFFWQLRNPTRYPKTVTILPDGYFDIIFYSADHAPFAGLLAGLSSVPAVYTILPNSIAYAISFKLPAAEQVLHTKIADWLNGQTKLPDHYWSIDWHTITDFKTFASVVTEKISSVHLPETDNRKQELFQLIYNNAGMITVHEIADTIHWSSRQINRYFNTWFGITLKKYCTILRYRASFKDIRGGKLFPEDHYTDQAHFIKEIKKFSGVTPKELLRNKNDRFIQFSTLPD